MGRRVVVTGLGVVGAAGCDVASFWQNLLMGRGGVSVIDAIEDSPSPVPFVAQIADDDLQRVCNQHSVRKTDRVTRLATAAAAQAWQDAGIQARDEAGPGLDPHRAGTIIGSGLGGLMFQEEQMWKVLRSGENRVHPHSVPRISPTALVTELAMRFQLRGPGFVVSSACASGAQALGHAFRSVRMGETDVMLAGGAEAPITKFTLTAFSLLNVLARKSEAPEQACKPFDQRRDGFVLGEGAGMLVLEEREHARARGARIYAELCGFGQTLGAHHAVAVRPDAEDAALAMQAALRDAEIDPEAIGYVNAHGTGTVDNDIAESRALQIVFGKLTTALPVSSIKPLTGHSLGAAGALEAVATVLTLSQRRIPPSANCSQRDALCNINVVQGESRATNTRFALSNSFGFGNINVALAFGRDNDEP